MLAGLCAVTHAHAAVRTHAAIELAGWGTGREPGESENPAALLVVAGLDGEFRWRPESIPENAASNIALPPAWGLRVHARGEGLAVPEHLRGRIEGRASVGLGYLLVAARLSHGHMTSLADRYWRSGRDLLVPGLGVGGRGWAWLRGPTELRALAWLAEARTPVRTALAGDASSGDRGSLDVGGAVSVLSLDRLKDDRRLHLGVFDTRVWRYGQARLLDLSIDVLNFRSEAVSGGWGGHAAIGMSALRLTPAPREEGAPSPGQATPAARIGLVYQGAVMGEFALATFHRIEPSGAAIDRGGAVGGQMVAPVGAHWAFAAAADVILARRVRVGTTLPAGSPQLHDLILLRRTSVSVSCRFGEGWRIGLRGWAESSDRDDSLRFFAAPTGVQQSLGAELGLSWERRG